MARRGDRHRHRADPDGVRAGPPRRGCACGPGTSTGSICAPRWRGCARRPPPSGSGSSARRRSRPRTRGSGPWPPSASGCPSGRSAPRSWPGTGMDSRGASRSTAAARTAWSGCRRWWSPAGSSGGWPCSAASSAVVQVLTDPASSIGGVVLRTRAQGLVEGVAGGRLRLKLAVSEEALQPGDLVVTSGIGELFPKGLPLGRVLRVVRADRALPHGGARARRRPHERRGSAGASARDGRGPGPGVPGVLSRAPPSLRARRQRGGARAVHGGPGGRHRAASSPTCPSC